jgi:hypothetical protein
MLLRGIPMASAMGGMPRNKKSSRDNGDRVIAGVEKRKGH